MSKKPDERLKVERQVDIDTKRIFDQPLPEIISYLSEVIAANPDKEIFLSERWPGYEENEFLFVYEELEGDTEYEARMAEVRRKDEERQKALKREAEIKAIDRQIMALNAKRRSLT